jgi:hypothetical protein
LTIPTNVTKHILLISSYFTTGDFKTQGRVQKNKKEKKIEIPSLVWNPPPPRKKKKQKDVKYKIQ